MTLPPIEFYFDFSSPYGYLASHRIDHIAERHQRRVAWRPLLLIMVFKATGGAPISSSKPKWDYAKRDLARAARLHNIPFTLSEPFPFSGTAATRAFYWIERDHPAAAHRFAKAAFDAAFSGGRDVASIDGVVEVARPIGVDVDQLRAALGDPEVKQKARAATEAALAKGVCGSPFFLVDGEPFWGNDRLLEVDSWLSGGGW
jgi:2-hydroxychromene-2-carboxylate isomerase